MNDWIVVEVIHGGREAVLELLFGGDADVTQNRTGELREEAVDEVEPGAMFGCEGELKSAGGLFGQPSSGFPRDLRGMIVEDQMDCHVGRVGRIEDFEELDELAAAVAILSQGVNLAGYRLAS